MTPASAPWPRTELCVPSRSRADRLRSARAPPGRLPAATARWKVSTKIQQLLNTLKRPKRRPLPEFYMDDEEELEMAARVRDPAAPKPEGGPMTPAVGEHLEVGDAGHCSVTPMTCR